MFRYINHSIARRHILEKMLKEMEAKEIELKKKIDYSPVTELIMVHHEFAELLSGTENQPGARLTDEFASKITKLADREHNLKIDIGEDTYEKKSKLIEQLVELQHEIGEVKNELWYFTRR